ncbi:ATP-binding protein [Noviherbaspirillum sp.]|uniref:ATP-binding protein n=1 Tax=Noviherbaspirillum sp. TaxID=1926288 RepID=UPI002B46FAC3|nr:ATP-binding protein [Noviherbaspirillum sp.]HJV83659.1 ATP-binding protein [Noviherbaspirillum sp.]
MKTSPDQLKAYIEAPEGPQIEFKEASQNYHFEKLVDYCVALANEGGGKIIFGVTDRRPRRVVGTAAFVEPGRTEGGLFERLRHRVPVEELFTPDGERVVIVHVPSRLPGTAWNHNGRYLKRAGEDLVPLGDAELKAMFAEAGLDFSAEACPGATLADLAPEAIADFRARWARKAADPRRLQWTDEETLINAELLVDGRINYAALILFGARFALGRHLAQAEIVFEYRSSEASGPAADRQEYREGFFLIHDALWQRINLRNDRQSYQEDLFRMEIPTFDEIAIREGLLNAVAHRDYRLGGSVFVRQFSRRLEIVSPGGFPPGITADNILDQQNPRNRRLAEALAKCGLIERSGQGMNLMVESAIRQSKPLPSFAGTSAHEVRLTLEGMVDNPAFVRYLERLGDARLRSFSTHDFLALDYLRRDAVLPEVLKDRLPGLIEVGAVESVGRGRGTRYMLSHGLYAAIGAKGTYTRMRGLDHETNKSLLEQHLRQQGDNGAPLAELRQVLPALSENAVQRLLKELHEQGRVELKGLRRWARWFFVERKEK